MENEHERIFREDEDLEDNMVAQEVIDRGLYGIEMGSRKKV